MPRLLMFNFARGLAVGLGTLLGASVLLSMVVWALSQIEFLPIIGEFAAQIAEQMNDARESSR
jgi:type IV secretory pathway TrbF-like protein